MQALRKEQPPAKTPIQNYQQSKQVESMNIQKMAFRKNTENSG